MVKEAVFIDEYLSNGYDTRKAVIKSKITTSNPARKGNEILNRPIVAKEISKRLEARTKDLFINETVIMNQLWQEATLKGPGSTQAGRVQALLHLGKHIGMFNTSKAVGIAGADKGTTINIMNYNNKEGKMIDTGTIVDTSEKKKIKEIVQIEVPKIEGVSIRKFDA